MCNSRTRHGAKIIYDTDDDNRLKECLCLCSCCEVAVLLMWSNECITAEESIQPPVLEVQSTGPEIVEFCAASWNSL